MPLTTTPELPLAVLDILPNPVLVKDHNLKYVWVNAAFEALFNVRRENLIGRLDTEVFKERQSTQCNGGDLRVLKSGDVDEAYETVYKNGTEPRETITRKNRLSVGGAHYLVGVMHDVTEISHANDALRSHKDLLEEQSLRLAEMAYSDPLTSTINRRRLAELAPAVFGTHRNVGSVLMCDLDRFKAVNDTYGHDAGDAALKHFVMIAQSTMREGDLIARLGGEEFVIVLPSVTKEESMAIAERLRKALETTPVTFKKQSISLTTSIGAAHIDGQDFDLESLLKTVDTCLYEAKDGGRNKTVMAA